MLAKCKWCFVLYDNCFSKCECVCVYIRIWRHYVAFISINLENKKVNFNNYWFFILTTSIDIELFAIPPLVYCEMMPSKNCCKLCKYHPSSLWDIPMFLFLSTPCIHFFKHASYIFYIRSVGSVKKYKKCWKHSLIGWNYQCRFQ